MFKKIIVTIAMFFFYTTAYAGVTQSIIETDYNFSPRGSYVDIPDIDGSGSQDIAVLGFDVTTNQPLIVIKDSLTGSFVKYITYFDAGWNVVWDLQKLDDANGNTYPELALKATNITTGETKIQIVDPYSGTEIIGLVFAGAGSVGGGGGGSTTNSNSLTLVTSSQQYLSISDASQTGLDVTGDITIEAWIKLQSFGTWTIVSKGDSYLDSAYNFMVTQNGLWAQVQQSNNSTINSIGQTDFTLGVWTHVAMTWSAGSGNYIKLYINGQEDTYTQNDIGFTSIQNSGGLFYIGARKYNNNMSGYPDGIVDDVRVWNIARTQTEIAQNISVELSGTEAGLQGYWRLNNDYIDATSNGNNLTPINSPVFSTDVPF